MSHPPATRIPLGASWWYRGFVTAFTIFLIATYIVNTWTTGIFDTQNGLVWLLAGLAVAWAGWDAWRPRRGVLHYADGQWVLALGDVEHQGTIHPVIDLPDYLMVKFTPIDPLAADSATGQQTVHHTDKKQFHPLHQEQCQEKWLHLEPSTKLGIHKPSTQGPHQTQQQATVAAADWLALRRAVFAQAAR
jgi:hypothetical protein